MNPHERQMMSTTQSIKRGVQASVTAALLGACLCGAMWGGSASAASVPAQLPRPDGKPGNATKPVRETTVALGAVSAELPTLTGSQSLVARAAIDVPATGTYTVHPGYGDSTHAIVRLGDQEVYRKEVGGEPVITKIVLEKGKRYPINIVFLKSGSAALWLEQVDLPGKGDLTTLTASCWPNRDTASTEARAASRAGRTSMLTRARCLKTAR